MVLVIFLEGGVSSIIIFTITFHMVISADMMIIRNNPNIMIAGSSSKAIFGC